MSKVDLEIARARENVIKHSKEETELDNDFKSMKKDKSFYNDELKRLNTYNDPSGLTIEQI